MPIIGLDHQGVHDIVTDEAGIKVPVKTPAKTALALAQALEKLARDPALRLSMGRCAWQNASEYAWPKRALAMTKIYAAVLNRSRDSMEPTCLT
jgi:glycosyltransferase involved in cell wall biosynthesis